MDRALIAVDDDEQRARAVAEAVADLPRDPEDVEVVVLNVFREFTVAGDSGNADSEDFYDEEAFPESASVAEAYLEERGISVSKRREHGKPADEIVSVAGDIDADLIALAARKRTPAGKVLFGSVSQSVLLAADRPVLAVTTS
jgi:nucleotide-binding universal stress UspA family protein